MTAATTRAVAAVLTDELLASPGQVNGTQSHLAWMQDGPRVVVYVEPPAHVPGPFGQVDEADPDWLLGEAATLLRSAGFSCERVGDELTVTATEVVGVAHRFGLSRDQEAEERGRHEIETKGDAA